MNIIGTPLDLGGNYNIPIFNQVKPYGVKGEIKVRECSFGLSFKRNSFVLFDNSEQEYKAQVKQSGNSEFIVKIDGIENRDQAAKLKNLTFCIRISEIDFNNIVSYGNFIKNFAVNSLENDHIGWARVMHNFGAGDLLEVEHCNKSSTFFYPFQEKFVGEINFFDRYLRLGENYKDFI
ncbi:ribosome maturation factor RimM [Candidatus Bandiella euplotis]|uniref:Ribosome maturation factor RimM n=1 Tax=Candidatus Bandiella euplotis TaxID=1664265 RepID=A0ABZ0UL00_9RICK|nr:hypothetical protein [Candidatus Bandiella woodruffii]WPX96820.1 Ribosome maturation factor RimM [Candidatus Bandiella woodruffii]